MGRVRGQKPLTLVIYQALRSHGLNDSEIASVVRLTPQAVSRFKNTHARHLRSPREVAKDMWPMDVPYNFVQCSPYKRLRDHLEYMATGGKGMAKYKLERLRWFYRRLYDHNLILTYDPSTPPNRWAKTGGWDFVQRTDADGELVLRESEHVHMSPVRRIMFEFPPVLP